MFFSLYGMTEYSTIIMQYSFESIHNALHARTCCCSSNGDDQFCPCLLSLGQHPAKHGSRTDPRTHSAARFAHTQQPMKERRIKQCPTLRLHVISASEVPSSACAAAAICSVESRMRRSIQIVTTRQTRNDTTVSASTIEAPTPMKKIFPISTGYHAQKSTVVMICDTVSAETCW